MWLVPGIVLAVALPRQGLTARPGPPRSSPIKHVVILFQENHSFDEVLGYLCVQDHRCDGARIGTTHDGRLIRLAVANDIPPPVGHGPPQQKQAINGGRMNGFDLVRGCRAADRYGCYVSYVTPRPDDLGSIPNLAVLARAFVISDRTFESHLNASWAAHLDLVAGTNDGFVGWNPKTVPGPTLGEGWGCDSYLDAKWKPDSGSSIDVPSCVPARDGSGPYRPSPVSWVPTIMDRMDQAGLSWHIYGRPTAKRGQGASTYLITICPTFAECLNGPQRQNVVVTDQIYADAQQGKLPALSIVVPKHLESQHNSQSMLAGDNYIGRVVSAIMHGPQWSSTAIFITYDDCGCFYDHVPPPPGMGIRVPMVIVSPFARRGYTDSHPASFASMLAFVERDFDLKPLSLQDATAYDYHQSFDFTSPTSTPVKLVDHPLPDWETKWFREHLHDGEDDPDY